MNAVDVIEVGREAFIVILLTGGPILAAGLLIGVLIALFQALTSIQEMTLIFVPKILVIFATIILMLPFMINTVLEFARSLFDRMIALG